MRVTGEWGKPQEMSWKNKGFDKEGMAYRRVDDMFNRKHLTPRQWATGPHSPTSGALKIASG